MPKQFPNATPQQLVMLRQKKLHQKKLFPTTKDTTPTIAYLSQKFNEKSMVPPIWFTAAITTATAFTLTGSKIKINDCHSISTCVWFMIIGISSTRKGAVGSFFTNQLDLLQSLYVKHVKPNFITHLDGATIPAITAQTEINEGTLGVTYEEISEFRKQFKIDDADGLRSKLLSIHDGRPWKYKYKKELDISIERTYFVMLLAGQYETATDFLNTFKKEGFAPRIQPVYTPGVIPISSSEQKKAAKIWKDLKLDDKIHAVCVQLSYRFGINHLNDPSRTTFEHFISENATKIHDALSDMCISKLAELEFIEPDVGSAYGKLADRAVAVALNWTAFEYTWKLLEENKCLLKPLKDYSGQELLRLDPRLKIQSLTIEGNVLQQAFNFCEKAMLCDLGMREGYFSDSLSTCLVNDVPLSWMGKYLIKCDSVIMSVRYLTHVTQIRLGVKISNGKANVNEIKKMHTFMKQLNIGMTVNDDTYLILYDINKINDTEAIKQILLSYQYLGISREDIQQIFNCQNLKQLCISQNNAVINRTLQQTYYKQKNQ
eukprot:245107_1